MRKYANRKQGPILLQGIGPLRMPLIDTTKKETYL